MNSLNLRVIHHRLTLDSTRLSDQIARLEAQKSDLFQQGTQESSARLQTVFARRIRDLDKQAAALDCHLQVMHKQSLILSHLVYARENADRLNEGLLANVDWETLLVSVSNTVANQVALLSKLDDVLNILAPTQVATTPYTPSVHRTPQSTLAVAPPTFQVRSVPDGDGLKLEDGTRVRYIGIDAPEISGYDGKPEPFAEEAKAFNASLVKGQSVRLERDTSDTDRYGRWLRYVYVEGVFVNAELVKTGLATALTLWPDEQHAAELIELEAEAKKKQRGIWKK
jgi:endonuclease YncB( thermonuclease family)